MPAWARRTANLCFVRLSLAGLLCLVPASRPHALHYRPSGAEVKEMFRLAEELEKWVKRPAGEEGC